ncbi:hypothetical protein ACG04R_06920 [Roseateles sp. BYS78W]|uniref:Uncharacterized protein n=1 Tax=Pelomonas candidula TaxID=3299025 RepID=A0ABW7H915_9BURK
MRKETFFRLACRPRLLAVAAAASAVSGCAFFYPYVGFPKQLPEGWDRDPLLAGDASQAISQVEEVRRDYLKYMREMSGTRAVFATGAGVLTGWALYNAVKPNAPGTTEPTYVDKRRTAQLGAVIATGYGLSEYAVNKKQESAYNDGYRALTCLLRQSAPLLMPLRTQEAEKGGAFGQPLSAQALETALNRLSVRILDLQNFVAAAKVGLGDGNAQLAQKDAREAARLIAENEALPEKPGKDGKKKRTSQELAAEVARLPMTYPANVGDSPTLSRQIDDAVKALQIARNALADGLALQKAVADSGREIRERAQIIVTTVNGVVQDAQADLRAADSALTKAQDITAGFRKLGSQTSGDQAEPPTADTADTGAKTSSATTRIPAAQQSTAPGALRMVNLGGGPLLAGASLGTALLANATATAVQATKPGSATPSPLTTAELEKLNERIEALIADAKKREAAEAQEKLVNGYIGKIKDWSKPKDVCTSRRISGHVDAPDRCDAQALALLVEDLYDARRPVVAAVLHFRSQTKAVRRVAGCASDAGVHMTPNDTLSAQAGETVTFIINQPQPGTPVAVLQGTPGDDFGTLSVDSMGNAGVKAQVKFGKKAQGRYTLLATDSSGEYNESVLIVVKPAKGEAEKPASAASATSGAS